MKGVFAIGLLVIAYFLTQKKRMKQKEKRLNDQIIKNNKEIEFLKIKIAKIIDKI